MRSRILDIETAALDEAIEWLEEEPIHAPANYKDEAKKAEYIAKAEAERLEKMALDPDTARIVALGWHDIGSEPIVHLCSNEFEEREGLKLFWESFVQQETRIIGFNTHGFDLPAIVTRSIWLDVYHPHICFSPEWKSYPHVDLFQKLGLNGARKNVKRLRFYARRCKLPIYDDITGKDVAALVKDGSREAWEKIYNHCLSDLTLTQALAERLKVLPKTAVA